MPEALQILSSPPLGRLFKISRDRWVNCACKDKHVESRYRQKVLVNSLDKFLCDIGLFLVLHLLAIFDSLFSALLSPLPLLV